MPTGEPEPTFGQRLLTAGLRVESKTKTLNGVADPPSRILIVLLRHFARTYQVIEKTSLSSIGYKC